MQGFKRYNPITWLASDCLPHVLQWRPKNEFSFETLRLFRLADELRRKTTFSPDPIMEKERWRGGSYLLKKGTLWDQKGRDEQPLWRKCVFLQNDLSVKGYCLGLWWHVQYPSRVGQGLPCTSGKSHHPASGACLQKYREWKEGKKGKGN